MGEKHYIRSDGNGGINISHSIMIIAIVVTILMGLIPAVFAYGTLNQKVSQLIGVDDKIHDLEKTDELLALKLDDIQEDIRDIKKIIEKNS